MAGPTGLDQWEHDGARDRNMPDAIKGLRAAAVGAATAAVSGLVTGAVAGVCVASVVCVPLAVPLAVAAGLGAGMLTSVGGGLLLDLFDTGVDLLSGIRMPWDSP